MSLRFVKNRKLRINKIFFRKFLWKICSKKIFKVTFPSVELLNQLSDLNIFHEKQLIFLPDPILNIKEYIRKKKLLKKIS